MGCVSRDPEPLVGLLLYVREITNRWGDTASRLRIRIGYEMRSSSFRACVMRFFFNNPFVRSKEQLNASFSGVTVRAFTTRAQQVSPQIEESSNKCHSGKSGGDRKQQRITNLLGKKSRKEFCIFPRQSMESESSNHLARTCVESTHMSHYR